MAQGKAVQVDLHREEHIGVLSHAEGLDAEVHQFLAVFGNDLDPAGIAGVHEIAVVVPDTDGSTYSAVGNGHDDGQAQGGGDVAKLRHERIALGTGRGEGAGTGGGGADTGAHGTVFGFHRDELGVQVTVGDQFRKVFDDMSLRVMG